MINHKDAGGRMVDPQSAAPQIQTLLVLTAVTILPSRESFT